jgi:DNA topoisomerase-1
MSARRSSAAPPRVTAKPRLIKMLESEGIGRPSTYASIISVIQDRNYVEQQNAASTRPIWARSSPTNSSKPSQRSSTSATPARWKRNSTRSRKITSTGSTCSQVLRPVQEGPRRRRGHAHARQGRTTPAPAEYKCPQCGSSLVYRFGKNGRFLSCSTYPTCNYASPVDREGKPRPAAELVDVACPKCGSAMTKRVGKFGPFLGCSRYGDKEPLRRHPQPRQEGKVVAPSAPAPHRLPCPICQSPLNLRTGLRGPWLGCSRFPKCRGRGKWADPTVDALAGISSDSAPLPEEAPEPIADEVGV